MSTENNATVVRFEKLPDCLFGSGFSGLEL